MRWEGSPNRRAVGATLVLSTPAASYRREVRASSGYLSSNPSRVHFGFPAGTELSQLAVSWPDGATTPVEDLAADQLVTVTRLR